MGVGEKDFHRSRLTRSIECARIRAGLIDNSSERNESRSVVGVNAIAYVIGVIVVCMQKRRGYSRS
jgi:hypothetical protein